MPRGTLSTQAAKELTQTMRGMVEAATPAAAAAPAMTASVGGGGGGGGVEGGGGAEEENKRCVDQRLRACKVVDGEEVVRRERCVCVCVLQA